MLQASTLSFLQALKKNNTKEWFDLNRKKYDHAKADFVAFIEVLIAEISKFDPAVSALKAKECIFRINRDIRFSKDKSPYKTNMGAYINPGGKKINTPGYYFHCEPGASFIAGGLYVPEPPLLAKVRQEIDYNFEEWNKIVNNRSFKKQFGKVDGLEILSRPPKGYSIDNPAIEFLKMKSYIVSKPLPNETLTNKSLLKEIRLSFEAMKPMIDFLNKGLS